MTDWDSFVEDHGTPPLRPQEEGWACPAGDFVIDGDGSADRAVVTHAHADHLAPGHDVYYCSRPSVPLVRRRLETDDADFEIRPLDWNESLELGDATVSLHPAGHMLGSAQIRVEADDGTWVVSGDYKRRPDPTCRDFEVVPCDVFVTEATFGLPIYRWRPPEEVAREIFEWWERNRREGRSSLLFAYSVGKAQRILAHLAEWTDRRVLLHGALVDFVEAYRRAGVEMLPTEYVTDDPADADHAGELVMGPPSAFNSPWMERFPTASTGFASGWMRIRALKRRRGYDVGFVLSDHVDWPALLATIDETGADTVVAEHGDAEPLCRYLEDERDIDAIPLEHDTDRDERDS